MRPVAGLSGAAMLLMGVMKMTEPEVGDIIRCESSNGLPPIEIWVGKIESLRDLGVGGVSADSKLVHLQMVAIGDGEFPVVGHSPFALSALSKCNGSKIGARERPNDNFEDGYNAWLEAFQNGKAGYFTLNPAEAYWGILGVVDENRVGKQ